MTQIAAGPGTDGRKYSHFRLFLAGTFLAIVKRAGAQFNSLRRPGVAMHRFSQLTASLAERVNRIIAHTEAENPGMNETAAMVYVGDIVVLREQRHRRHADGWGSSHYSCESYGCRRLP